MKKLVLKFTFVCCAAVLLGGCSSVPLVSDSQKWDHASSDEQLAWISKQADDAVGVIGQDDGWYSYSAEFPWPEQRDATLTNLIPDNCRPNQKGPQPGRYSLDLDNESVTDPFEAAKRLRAHWAEQGWTITDVVPLGSTKDPIDYFRADREDGAGLALTASEHNVSLQLQSSCSDNNKTD